MLVSVVIPSYNHKKYVVRAIESVLDQNWPKVDLIVIDDGSKDGSPAVIQKLLDARGGFRFITRENLGLLKTLNEGLALAQGEFFCELASDDYLPVDSIEKRARFLQEHPECVAVFADAFLVENDEVVAPTLIGDKHRRMFAQPHPIRDMLEGALPVFSTGLIRRQALLAIGGFDDRTFRYYEDLDTPIRLALHGKLGFLDQPVIFRRQHGTNVSSSTNHVRTEKVLFYQKLLAEPRLIPYRRLLRKSLTAEYLKLGRCLSKTGREEWSREVFQKSWLHIWFEPRLLWYLTLAKLTKKKG